MCHSLSGMFVWAVLLVYGLPIEEDTQFSMQIFIEWRPLAQVTEILYSRDCESKACETRMIFLPEVYGVCAFRC